MAEPARQLPEEDQPEIRPRLSALEGGGESTERGGGHLASVPEPEEDDADEAATGGPGRHLRVLEGGAGKDSNDGLYNKEGDDPKNLGRLRGAVGRLRGGKGKLLKSLAKHKWLWGLGAGAVGSLLGLIFMIFILLAALKIPHLAENITAYQFARVFQQSAETNDRVVGEKVAVDAADQKMFGKLKAKYDAAGTKVSEKWSKFTVLQPNKVLNNMDKSGTLKFNYKQTAWGGQKIVGVTMGDTTALVQSKTTAQKLLPGYDFIKGLGKDNVSLVQQYQAAMKEGFRAQEIGPITRGLTAKEIRARLGISLTAWAIAKYKNLNEQKAALQEARDANAKISTPDPNEPTTASVKNATNAVEESEKETISDDSKLEKALANGGAMSDVETAVNKSVATSGFQTALGVANPAYAIATPACIVFDGSLDHSGSTIDANVNAQMKEYQYIASAGDQQKDGTDAAESAVGALNNRLADDGDSAPLQRGATNSAYTPPTTPSAEASSMGTFTILSALLGGGKAVDVVNKAAGGVCPALTNVYAASGVAILNILATVFTLGGAESAEGGVLQTVRLGVEKAATKVIDSVTTKAGAKLTAGKTASFLGDSLKTGVKIAGVTLAAKAIVLAKSGYANNGIDTGADTANNADAGGNLMAQNIEREQFYGRPLDKAETNDAAHQSMQLVYDQNQSQSAYQRYFALSNYNSLLTVMGTSMMSSLHHFSVSSMLDGLSKRLASPASLLTSTLLQTNHSLAFAANTYDTQQLNHGNVQFGWSAAETALSKEPEYGMLENQYQLDASGQEDTIASTYGKCFDGNTTIGTLLQDPDNGIARDDNGNVKDDEGTCAPRNLGPDDNGKFKSTEAQLVFRWRLAQRDDKGLATIADESNITSDQPAGTSPTNTLTVATYNMCQDDNHKCPFEGSKEGLISNFIKGGSTAPQLDIVGAEELSQSTQNGVINKLGSDYSTWPNVPSDQGRALFWNNQKLSLKDKGRLGGVYSNDGRPAGPSSPYAFPWVQLETADHQQVFVIASHSPNDDYDAAPARQKRVDNARALLAWAKQHDSGNNIVIITGDFNNSGTRGGSNSAYCILTSDGAMQQAHDMADGHNPNNDCPTPDPVHYAPLDSIYVSTNAGLTAKGWTWMGEGKVNADKTGTDHSPSFVTLNLPDSSGDTGSINQDAKNGWQWPLAKADYNGLSQCFVEPVRGQAGHTGIDLRAGVGTPVYAAHDGTVVKTDPSGSTDGGKYIIIKNGNGLYSNYQHNSQILVKAGQTVKAGQKISLSGNTGYTTGPHLHFSITTQAGLDSRYSVAYSVDPIPYLPTDRDTSPCH